MSIIKNFSWKFLERLGYQGVLAIVNIILARILLPNDFGELAIVNVVVYLAQAFVQQGLATALVREKDVVNRDYVNMILAGLGLASLFYILTFLIAPVIAGFYDMPNLKCSIRLMGAVLFPGAVNSVQNAKIVREGLFKKLFFSSVGSAILSGVLGIYLARGGWGVDSLVWQQVSFRILFCLTMAPIARIAMEKPDFNDRFKKQFGFGFKLMLSAGLNTLFGQVQNLVVGKKYDNSVLGAYNQGNTYPSLIIANINTSMQTVILPEYARHSANKDDLKRVIKKTLILSSYVICPLMIGFLSVADHFVDVFLTSKWDIAVPYIRIFCLMYFHTSLSTINLQAYNALGRSGIFLKNEIEKKIVGIAAIAVALLCFESPVSIAVSLAVSSVFSSVIDMWDAGSLYGYSYIEQVCDFAKNAVAACLMGGCVLAVNLLGFGPLASLGLQLVAGAFVYWMVSKLFQLDGYKYLLGYLRNIR